MFEKVDKADNLLCLNLRKKADVTHLQPSCLQTA
jgi:hypothetical protein